MLFGMVEIPRGTQITGIPLGRRYKVSMRLNEFVFVYVYYGKGGIEQWTLERLPNGVFKIGELVAVNYRCVSK